MEIDTAPSVAAATKEQLEVVRTLSSRLRLIAGITVPVWVLLGSLAAISIGNTRNGDDNTILGALGAFAGAFAGFFFFSAVRLCSVALLFVCEHLAGF